MVRFEHVFVVVEENQNYDEDREHKIPAIPEHAG